MDSNGITPTLACPRNTQNQISCKEAANQRTFFDQIHRFAPFFQSYRYCKIIGPFAHPSSVPFRLFLGVDGDTRDVTAPFRQLGHPVGYRRRRRIPLARILNISISTLHVTVEDRLTPPIPVATPPPPCHMLLRRSCSPSRSFLFFCDSSSATCRNCARRPFLSAGDSVL